MLAEITAWWVNQMRSLLPGPPRTSRQQDALIVVIDRLELGDTGFDAVMTGSILLRRDGLETVVQSLDVNRPFTSIMAPHLATGLRLPSDSVLSRDVLLPIAAARDLPAVLSFEMDRLTPFTVDEVFWSVSDVVPDRARARVSLQLSIVLRAPVEALSRALGRIGIIPSFIEAKTGRIDLDATHRGRKLGRQALLRALCGILFIACLAAPFIRQQMALNAVTQVIATYQPKAETAQALRQQLVTAAAGHSAIAEARQAGDALQVLAILTDALPDGTWLSDLTLKSGDLTFDGQSSDAAQLIGLLSSLPGLHDPSFTAPVTRTADGKADLFSMHVSVGQ
jgi:general secretion pathway protein L